MEVTGGSYMSQPNTNSEAVKRCLNIPSYPLSSQVCRIDPKPPYAVDGPKRTRPYSAPARRLVVSNYSDPWRSAGHQEPYIPYRNYDRSEYSGHPEAGYSMKNPYAMRKREAFVNSSLGYPEVKRGNSAGLAPYDPLNDPHLYEYFERRFGAIQAVARKRGRWSRPSSAGSTRSYSGTKRFRIDSQYGNKSGAAGTGPVLYKVFVTTSDKKTASTDAKVYLTLRGTKGKLTRQRLTKKAGSVKSNRQVAFKFSKGTTHMFKFRSTELGDIKSVIIEHDGVKKEDAWHLQEIEVVNTKRKKHWLFICNNWLSLYHGDGQAKRELFPHLSSKTKYEIVTVTADHILAGTDANVYITIYGRSGATEKIPLKNKNKNMFQQGVSDTFVVPANCVGPLTRIRIEHDNTGLAPGWQLERVVVTDLEHTRWKYYFPCGQWLARDEGDGSIVRVLLGSKDPFAVRKESKYKISVYTGKEKGAGTDANVYIILFGENGDSGEKRLDDKKNNFEKGQLDEFIIKCPCLGRLERLRIGHDNSGFAAGWFLDQVIVDDLDNGITYKFPCKKWLADDEDDGQIWRDLLVGVGPMEAGIPYIITVTTGDKPNAGTDAKVFVVLHGKKGDSGTVYLSDGKFKRGQSDIFHINIASMLSPLTSLEIGHDNSGVGPGWFCDQVIVFCPSTGIEQVFPCGKWFALGEGDGLIQRTLKENLDTRKKKEKREAWNIFVYTSDIKNAGTDANVGICLYGNKDKWRGKSDEMLIDNKGDNFEQGQVDTFKLSISDVGVPYKLRVYHDNSGRFAGWHLAKIEMERVGTKERYIFKCDKWLAEDEDDKQIVRELPAIGPGIKKPFPLERYLIQVYTGKKFQGGTDANVYINVFGERGDTGNRFLKHSKTNRNKFESGQLDEFEIEAVSLLKLTKIRIGHDNAGVGSGWFLDKVVVKQYGEPKYDTEFVCNRWLAKDQDDGQIEREITASGAQMLSTTSYHVHVKTGDVSGAGTDANVHLIIYGAKGDTGKLKLRQSATYWNKFERGKTDIFTIEATDIGQIKRIKIGHDGSNPGAGWFLDEVKILVPSRGEQYIFACHRWLAVDEDDRQLEIEMTPSFKQDMEKTIPYEVTIWTGDVSGAGTDANVFLQMYGLDGKTEEYNLRNKTDNFERGEVEKFKLEAADIGRILKVRIGHDGKGMASGWFLEKMLIQRRPRKGTKKMRRASIRSKSPGELVRKSVGESVRSRSPTDYRSKSPGESFRSRSPADYRSRSPTDYYRDDYSDYSSDDTDISSVSQSRRRPSKKLNKKPMPTVKEEVEEYDGTETEDYWFYVKRWFAKSEDDKQIVRELIPTDEKGRPLKGGLQEVEYVVRVFTGDKFGAGTDANVFVNITGDKGDTGERALKESQNFNKFERKQEDTFTIKAIELGKLQKLKIRHDNAGGGAAWFLDRVEVEDPLNKKNYIFYCQRWLSTKEDDGQISRELVPVDASVKSKLGNKDAEAVRKELALETKAAMTTYYVHVTTGTVFGAGTDANVYVVLHGEEDTTGTLFLKSSHTHRNKFESGNTDLFILEAVKIGELKKIKIGHDNAGGGAPWYLEKVLIECPSMGRNWTFQAKRWLDKSKGDGLLEVELYPQELATEEYVPCIPYEVITYTTDKSSAGTSANVYIQLYGKETCTQQKCLTLSKMDRKDKYKRGAVDRHIVELEDVGDTIEKIRIGHDNAGIGSGWHLDKVEVRRLHESGKGSMTYTFPCGRWLARDEEDGAIERELVASRAIQETLDKSGEVKQKEVKIRDKLQQKVYTVSVKTGDVSGAGTDANVFLTIYGDKGDTGERKLHKSETHMDKFEKGHTDVFKMEAADLGNIYKIKIRHDNKNFSPAWYLDNVEIKDGSNNQPTMFYCERWLAKNKDDGKIERSFYVKGYEGDMSSTGTLRSSRMIGSTVSMDSLRSTDPFSKSPRLNRKQMAMEEIPEGPTIPYTVRVTTGDGEDNGTTANVWIKIIGPKKVHTGRLFLELAQKNRFEPRSVEIFSIEAVDVNEVKKIEIGHDGTHAGSGWFVKEVEVDMPTKGKHYTFSCKSWLARDKGDGKTSREFNVVDGLTSVLSYRPMIPYEMTVYTGDIAEAGTDQKITVTVFGSKGSSSPIVLEKTENRFERDREDLIKMELEDIAPLKKMRVETDGKGSRPDWYLEKVELYCCDTGQKTVFMCRDWFSKKKGDGKLVRDLVARERGKDVIGKTSYRISVKTSDVRGAGTDANVYVILFGANGDSGELHLKKSETYKDPFENNQVDVFTFENMLSLGELAKCRVWHDNKGFGAAWHLAHIEVEDLNTKKVYLFHCDRWLSKSEDDKQILRELTCGTSAKGSSPDLKDRTNYEIEIKTTDKSQGGTYHNAWLILEGKNKNSKIFKMENSPQNKILRRGNTDNFSMLSAPLGDIKHCVIGAYERDDLPLQSAEEREAMWHCHEVVVTDTSKGKKYVFPCKSWIKIYPQINKKQGIVLDVKKVEESQVSIVRSLAAINYEVVVHTGDLPGCGTNANVFITIFGEHGDTGKRALTQKWRDLFERKQVDKFQLEAVDLGELTKIIIEHDNKGLWPGWYLDKVEINNLTSSKTTVFPCEKWLDKGKGDGAISRELYPRD